MVFCNAKGLRFIDSTQWNMQWYDTCKRVNQFYKNGFLIMFAYTMTVYKLQDVIISTNVVVDIYNAFALN